MFILLLLLYFVYRNMYRYSTHIYVYTIQSIDFFQYVFRFLHFVWKSNSLQNYANIYLQYLPFLVLHSYALVFNLQRFDFLLNFLVESKIFIVTSYLQTICSVQFSCSAMSNSLWPHKPQHARPPCPSPTPEFTQTRSLSRWCHLTISSSVVPFSSCFQSFPT